MADFSISLTVPDGKAADLLAAINWKLGRNMNGTEARAWLKTTVEAQLKSIYMEHQRFLRNQQADDSLGIQ